MEYKNYGTSIYTRLDKGDEVLESIAQICKKENITTASISGIGGCGEVVVGTYKLDKQDYEIQTQTGMLEMLSINGNVTLKDNEPFVHAHALFSYLDENNNSHIIGGHLKKAEILLTGEIVINPISNKTISRKKDDTTGISIWNFQ